MEESKYGNPILDACTDSLMEASSISEKMFEQYRISSKAREEAEKFQRQLRSQNIQTYKELAEEILSRDLGLSEEEYNFVTIQIRFSKDPGRKTVPLLEELIMRNRNTLYPPLDSQSKINLSKFYNIVGLDVDIDYFFKNLNKKLDGMIILEVSDYMRKIYKNKICVSVEFFGIEKHL